MGKGGQYNRKRKTSKTTTTATAVVDSDNNNILNYKEIVCDELQEMSTEQLQHWATMYSLHLDTQTLNRKGVNECTVNDLTREELLLGLEPLKGGILDTDRPHMNLPLEKPPFNLTEITKLIKKGNPAIFEHSLFTSLWYLFSDLAMVALFYCLMSFVANSSNIPIYLKYILWPIYWYSQGSVMTGLWVLAHECGHGGFAANTNVNYWIGTILHSALLVPFHSWRLTHKLHHSNTGSCENDEVFAPSTRADWKNEALRDTPLAQAWGIFLMLTVGWLPGYLIFNITGPSKYKGKNVNHFSTNAVFFNTNDKPLVDNSIKCWFIAFMILCISIYYYSLPTVGAYYLIPYMITNYHLVLITYLQHTDVYMPHFRGKEWNFLRGALCTVDRSFGPLLDHTFHHITDTHVCHHLFSAMPFYHAAEATELFKPLLGNYYLKDDTPIARALYRAFSNCLFVEDDGNVVYYKSKRI